MPFAAYYGPKDLVGAAPLGAFFAWLVFFHPDALGHPDNLVPANPYATPAHLVPEWYFLWVYAILRSIPSKPLGVVAVAAAMGLLIALPFLVDRPHRGRSLPVFRLGHEVLFWTFLADVALLTWVGAQPILPSTVLLGVACLSSVLAMLLSWSAPRPPEQLD